MTRLLVSTGALPTYPWFGYGAVNEDTLEHVKRVVRGQVPIPARRVEDAPFGLDQDVRRAMVEVEP